MSARCCARDRCCSPTCTWRPMPHRPRALMKSGATAIAYETVTAPNGSLPLLTPMSEVAGRMSIQVGAASLQKANGGFGVLLGGVPGVRAGQGGDPRRRCFRYARRRDGGRPARGRHRGRSLGESPARAIRDLRLGAAHDLLDHRDHRAPGARRGSRGRGGAGRRRRGAEADHPRHGEDHEAGGGAGGHLHRPGRLLRDQPADHARRPDLRGRWRHPLLRRQHAGRGAAHLHARPDQRHAALRTRAGGPGLAGGPQARRRACRGPERARGRDHPRGRSPGPSVAARAPTCPDGAGQPSPQRRVAAPMPGRYPTTTPPTKLEKLP